MIDIQAELEDLVVTTRHRVTMGFEVGVEDLLDGIESILDEMNPS